MKRDTGKYIVLSICVLGMAACVPLLFPQVRQIVIAMAERHLVRRELLDHAKWMRFLLRRSFEGMILCAGTFVLYRMKHKLYPIRTTVLSINWRAFLKPSIFMAVLYAAGIFSIIRANFLYIDDLGRAISGYRGWDNFSRHVNNFLAVFIHTDMRITDISPLPQIFAVVCMAVSSVLLVYIVSDKKISLPACFLSLPAGLSPYFLECFSYKFDSPYMALSVLASVVPFLFVQNYFVFSLCSVVSVLIMCMTYQASSGIYAMIAVFLCFKAWNERDKTNKEIIRFAGVCAASYSGAMIFFRLFLMKPVDSYISTGMHPLSGFFSGVLRNLMSYMRLVSNDFGILWKILVVLTGITFLVTAAAQSKRNRIASLAVSFIAAGVLCALSFGVYLCLAKPLDAPRSMYGFGVCIALFAVYSASCHWKAAKIPAVLLCWCFFVFAFSYGNALADQKRYNDFRTEILLHDLSIIFPDRNKNTIPITLQNNIGFAPVVQNIAVRNPVIQRLVPVGLQSGWIWGYAALVNYYQFKLDVRESWSDNIIEDEGLAVVLDSYYHTIKSDGEKVLVILKTAQ